MKIIALVLSALSLIGSCSTQKHSVKLDNLKKDIVIHDTSSIKKIANTISSGELKYLVDTLSSKTFNGRKVGTEGLEKASEFVVNYYKKQNIKPALPNSYFQNIPETAFKSLKGIKAQNILAFIEGSEKPNEIVLLSAHIDHLGNKHNQIHYGADDNASGTAAIMQIGRAFQYAKNKGIAPKRSIVIAHFTAEEIGLYGSRFYAKNPEFKLTNTVVDLNIDMIGRVDKKHENNPNYIYIIGDDRLSKHLHFISEKMNSTFTNLELDYTFNAEDDPNRYYYRSDHYSFASKNIPSIFYFNGEHEDYHKPTDTKEKINFKLLEKRTKLIFYTAWHIANMDGRLIMNDKI